MSFPKQAHLYMHSKSYLNVYKGLVNEEDLKCYVEQMELLKREYLFAEFGKILQG